MIDKVFQRVQDAVADVPDGATILLSGFGEAGSPDNLIEALRQQGARDLTIVSNNAGYPDYGLGGLIADGRVRKLICTFPNYDGARAFRERYLAGTIELELVPQGTLAERLRAAGSGLAAFYTPTGADTELAEGKEKREFRSRPHVLELALPGDYAFVRAQQADRWGNLVYRRAQRNFGPVIAMAGKVTVVEVQEVVPLGSLDPDVVVTPGVFVQRVVACPRFGRTSGSLR